MKEFKDNYNASDIDILDGLDPVRKRPAMYIGSTNVRGLFGKLLTMQLMRQLTDTEIQLLS